MRTILLILFTIAFISCDNKTIEPQPTQQEITYPILDAIYVQEQLYIILPDGIQYISFQNNKTEYTFFYYSEKIVFKAVRLGDDIKVSYKGVDILAKAELTNK